MKDLETRAKESWIGEAYRNEWPTMPNNIIAAAASTGITAVVTYLAKEHFQIESDEALTLTATLTDLSTYYAVLFSQFLYRDKNDLKEDNKFNLRKTGRKLGEYASFFGVLTAIYTGARMAAQYTLQKLEVDPVTASTVTQLGLTGVFTGALPMLRYSLKNLWKSNV